MNDALRGADPLLRDDLERALTGAAGAFADLAGARVFVTGGTGFVGAWLLEAFVFAVDHLGLRARATVLTRDAAGFRARCPHLAAHRAVALHPGDVAGFEPPEGTFTHVIHAATASSAPAHVVTPLDHVATIVDGTRRVLAFARERGVQRLLYLSSGAVYGAQPRDLALVTEDQLLAPDPTDRASTYGLAKRLAEHLCVLAAADGGPAPVLARGFAFSGPHLPLDAHFAFGNFVRDGLAGRAIAVGGDGTPVRSYLYGADLAVWLWRLLQHGSSARAYNVGSEATLDIRALATRVAAHFGVGVAIAAKPTAATPPARYAPSTERVRRELGVAEHFDIDDQIARTTRWWRARGLHARRDRLP